MSATGACSRPLQWVQPGSSLDITNRAGRIVHLPLATPSIRRAPCFAPTDMVVVTVTGDVVLCYEDSERTEVMGNVLESHLDEIWSSPHFTNLRTALREGRRADASDLCTQCTNLAHVEPGSALIDEPFHGTRQPPSAAELIDRAARIRARL